MTACTSHSVTHTVTVGDRKITYELTRKKVKNINLRIKPDGTVHVSASTAVTIAVIERFIRERADFILGAIDKFNAKTMLRSSALKMKRFCRYSAVSICSLFIKGV